MKPGPGNHGATAGAGRSGAAGTIAPAVRQFHLRAIMPDQNDFDKMGIAGPYLHNTAKQIPAVRCRGSCSRARKSRVICRAGGGLQVFSRVRRQGMIAINCDPGGAGPWVAAILIRAGPQCGAWPLRAPGHPAPQPRLPAPARRAAPRRARGRGDRPCRLDTGTSSSGIRSTGSWDSPRTRSSS